MLPTTENHYSETLNDDLRSLLKALYLILFTYWGTVGEATPGLGRDTDKKSSGFVRSVKNYNDAAKAFNKLLAGEDPDLIKQKFNSMLRMEHPDKVLLRFLKAERLNLVNAATVLAKSLKWRANEVDVDRLLEKGEIHFMTKDLDEGFINQYIKGKAFISGRDKAGRPVIVINVKVHNPRAQSVTAMRRFTLLCVEEMGLCQTQEIDSGILIFDMTDFGLSNMDYGLVKYICDCVQTYYPDQVENLYVHNAPWFFSGVWNIIKGWLNPTLADRIVFTKSQADLLKIINSDQLPATLGGASKRQYKWIAPNPKDDEKMQDMATKYELNQLREQLYLLFEQETVMWLQSDGAESKRIANERDKIALKLEQNFWQFDPYVRSRCVFDRDGVLAELQPALRSSSNTTLNGSS